MKLETVILKNFRGYKGEHRIPINDLTAIIGKNDAGKSTILEALDVFFNGSPKDTSDLCVFRDPSDDFFWIGCEFSDFPETLILDENAPTSLKDEHLLNKNGNLEIIIKIDCSSGTISAKNIKKYFISNYPKIKELDILFEKKQPALQKLITSNSLEDDCNQNENPSMRKALFTRYINDQTLFEEIDIECSKKIEEYFPLYQLFKSDRPSTDTDEEAQNPLKIAIKEALEDLNDSTKDIMDEITKKLKEVTTLTLEKLKEIAPELADELEPHVSEPDFSKVFKVSISDEKIPINKRGSGVRRLILLSFFRAQAELNKSKSGRKNLIYAIEEPETSQHPNFQRMLLNSFNELIAQGGCQIIITTHTPEIAKFLPADSLCLIKSEDNLSMLDDADLDNLYSTIAETLGLHAYLDPERVKLILCSEGPTDLDLLKNLSAKLHLENPSLPDLSQSNIACAFLPFGGSNLLHHATKSEYLLKQAERLPFKVVGFVDSDKGGNQPHRYRNAIVALRPHADIIELSKRTIENYLHHDAINEYFELTLPPFSDTDDIPLIVAKALYEKAAPPGRSWDNLEEKKQKEKLRITKGKLANYAPQYMNLERLDAINGNEIFTLLQLIQRHLSS